MRRKCKWQTSQDINKIIYRSYNNSKNKDDNKIIIQTVQTMKMIMEVRTAKKKWKIMRITNSLVTYCDPRIYQHETEEGNACC